MADDCGGRAGASPGLHRPSADASEATPTKRPTMAKYGADADAATD